jgi:hypothetical protein
VTPAEEAVETQRIVLTEMVRLMMDEAAAKPPVVSGEYRLSRIEAAVEKLLKLHADWLLGNLEWDDLNDTQAAIWYECDRLRDTLLDKNRKYGNSALEPVRIFSSADPLEQIRVRIDDKLSRIRNAQADDTEDTLLDLAGYLILYRIAQQDKAA